MALDRDAVRQTFEEYTADYDRTDSKVELKIDHTYRVAHLCDVISDSLDLSEADRDFAWLSGMLHDIGRFEQLRRYHTFLDKNSVNHAALSADLLFKEDLIRRFAGPDEIDYGLMDRVIRYHNVLALPEHQDARERMFCDILRDADKIDILKVNCETPRSEIYDLPEEAFAESEITDAVLQDIFNERNVDRRNSRTGIDFILGHISFVFGLIYPESVRQVRKQGYLQQLLDYESRNPDTAEKMQQINEVVNMYIRKRTETGKMTNVRELKNGKLYFDGCDTTELAKQYGTPLYVMSYTEIMNRINELKEQFTDKYPNARIAYASKAFCTEGMYEILKKADCCIDVVSGGELYTAEKVGFPAEHVEFNGNNKLPKEIDQAVRYGVGRIILDGLQEVPLIEEACKKYNKKMNIMIRITPGVAASTHDYIVTGKKDSKFGVPLEEEIFLPIVKQIVDSEYLNFTGLHMHVGSQLFENDAFLKALNILMDWAAKIKKEFDADVKEVNFGGGYGVTYTNEERMPYSFFLDPMMEILQKRSEEIGIECPAAVIEPGRSVVAEAGLTLYTVGQIKDIPGIRKYVSIDGGMGDNIRVAMYQAEYEGMVANKADQACDEKVTVCGKYCESGDILMTDTMVPSSIEAGDIYAMFSTGAYGYAMASNYNNNPIPGVVMVKEGKSGWMVKPQTYEQIIQNNEIPDFI